MALLDDHLSRAKVRSNYKDQRSNYTHLIGIEEQSLAAHVDVRIAFAKRDQHSLSAQEPVRMPGWRGEIRLQTTKKIFRPNYKTDLRSAPQYPDDPSASHSITSGAGLQPPHLKDRQC